MNQQPTRTDLEINDNTGTFSVFFYHKDENVIPKALQSFDYEEGCYVKLYGQVRVFKDKKGIVGQSIHKVSDFDEITNHFLQVFMSYTIKKKGVIKETDAVDDTNASAKVESGGDFKRLVSPTLSSHPSYRLLIHSRSTLTKE